MTVKAKRFRIGVEGATTDGREIQREWLEQMAASYNPAVYTALINLEHIKSYLPDSTFSWFEYEPATGRWYVRGIKSMVIEAADNITMKTSEFVLEADRTRINSEVVINGGVNGRQAVVAGSGADGRTGKSMAPD